MIKIFDFNAFFVIFACGFMIWSGRRDSRRWSWSQHVRHSFLFI